MLAVFDKMYANKTSMVHHKRTSQNKFRMRFTNTSKIVFSKPFSRQVSRVS